jgi:hypothetical protein
MAGERQRIANGQRITSDIACAPRLPVCKQTGNWKNKYGVVSHVQDPGGKQATVRKP